MRWAQLLSTSMLVAGKNPNKFPGWHIWWNTCLSLHLLNSPLKDTWIHWWVLLVVQPIRNHDYSFIPIYINTMRIVSLRRTIQISHSLSEKRDWVKLLRYLPNYSSFLYTSNSSTSLVIFFIFSHDRTEAAKRESETVDAEFRRSLHDEVLRMRYLLSLISDPSHPFSRFTAGMNVYVKIPGSICKLLRECGGTAR